MEGDKVRESHGIANYHAALCRRAGLGGTFKLFRKTSASRLRRDPRYADLRHHFLGESPRTVADRAYAEPPQDLFAEAVHWLRTQYELNMP
jgi:hypothetical protein